MRRETRNAVLSVPCDVAYEFLLDYANDLKWRGELKAVELVSGVGGEPGAQYSGTIDWHGMSVPHEYELVGCSRPSRIHFKSEISNVNIEVVYNLYDKGPDACYLTVDYLVDMDGPLVILEPFGWALLMGWVDDDLPRLPAAVLDHRHS